MVKVNVGARAGAKTAKLPKRMRPRKGYRLHYAESTEQASDRLKRMIEGAKQPSK